MLFALLKLYARFAIKIYCRKIIINNPEYVQASGPLLLAANHPNSFLDGVIMTTLFKHPIYSLARGDAFKHKRGEKILRWLRLLPVYRTSEGTENLSHNYTTFASCEDVFGKNGIVIIFSEGACVNEWHLRPLKKGTARLAISAWQKGIDLTVLPVGFNYNTFRNFGKNVYINFGEPIQKAAVIQQSSEGKQLLQFNAQLEKALQPLVYELDANNKEAQKEKLYVRQSFLKRILLFMPAFAGWLLHAPLYYPAKYSTAVYFNNDHYDSVLVFVLMLAYPLYLFLLCMVAGLLYDWQAVIITLIIMPFSAWCCVQLKKQLGN